MDSVWGLMEVYIDVLNDGFFLILEALMELHLVLVMDMIFFLPMDFFVGKKIQTCGLIYI